MSAGKTTPNSTTAKVEVPNQSLATQPNTPQAPPQPQPPPQMVPQVLPQMPLQYFPQFPLQYFPQILPQSTDSSKTATNSPGDVYQAMLYNLYLSQYQQGLNQPVGMMMPQNGYPNGYPNGYAPFGFPQAVPYMMPFGAALPSQQMIGGNSFANTPYNGGVGAGGVAMPPRPDYNTLANAQQPVPSANASSSTSPANPSEYRFVHSQQFVNGAQAAQRDSDGNVTREQLIQLRYPKKRKKKSPPSPKLRRSRIRFKNVQFDTDRKPPGKGAVVKSTISSSYMPGAIVHRDMHEDEEEEDDRPRTIIGEGGQILYFSPAHVQYEFNSVDSTTQEDLNTKVERNDANYVDADENIRYVIETFRENSDIEEAAIKCRDYIFDNLQKQVDFQKAVLNDRSRSFIRRRDGHHFCTLCEPDQEGFVTIRELRYHCKQEHSKTQSVLCIFCSQRIHMYSFVKPHLESCEALEQASVKELGPDLWNNAKKALFPIFRFPINE